MEKVYDVVLIYDNTNRTHIKITEAQKRLLDWLEKHQWLDDYVEIEAWDESAIDLT